LKTKLALILGIICMAISALTLFSALSHADSAPSTLTFYNADGLSGYIKGASVLSSNLRVVRLDVSLMNFPKAGELSMIFIKFPNDYEASVARDILLTQRMDLTTPYILHTAGTKYPAEVVPLANSEGGYTLNEAPKGVLLSADRVQVIEGNNLLVFHDIVLKQVRINQELMAKQTRDHQSVVAKQIRDQQLNQGIYNGAYGKMMWVLDGLACRGKAFEKDKCHEDFTYSKK